MNRSTTLVFLARTTAIGLALGAFQCINKPMDPVLPNWDVDVAAPIANRTYTLGEIVSKDTSILAVAPGGTQLMLKTSVQSDPTLVGDRISLDGFNTSFSTVLGPFSVEGGKMRLNVSIPGFAAGQSTIIPPIPPTNLPAATGDLPFIESVYLESGSVSLRIENRMPVAMRLESPITAMNEGGAAIAQFDFGTSQIASGESRTATADVGGKTVLKRIRLDNIRISTPGSGLSFVTIPDTMLLAEITPTALVATNATVTNLATQHLSVTRDLPLTGESLVRDVWINRGTLTMHFVSSVGMNTSLRLHLPELLRSTGVAFDQVLNIGPRDSVDLNINLAGYRLHSQTGDFIRSIRAECTADASPASGSAITVRSTDYVMARVTSTAVVADSAVAAIQPTVIAIDETIGLNLGNVSNKFRGKINLPAANMSFTPRTSINVPMELNLRFEARDKKGVVTSSLAVPVTKGAMGANPINFAAGDVGTFLSSISGTLPDSLRVVGSVVINPDYDTTSVSAIGRNCAFAADVDISVPMSLSIVGGAFTDTLTLGDTTGDGNADKRIDEKTLADMNSGQLHVEIDNGTPLALKVKLGLMDRLRKTLLLVPQTEGDSIAINGGLVLNGDVYASSHSSFTINLGNADIRQFNAADLVKLDLALATSGSGSVNFRTTDQVRVRVWTQFSYKVNP
jgi:hypothetical protein